MAGVVVTAANSRYFPQLVTLLDTTLASSAGAVGGVVVWDLGLRRAERSVLARIPRVELRSFPIPARWPYPDWLDPRSLRRSYAFKPYAVLNAAFPGDAVLWIDAGVIVLRDLAPILELVRADGVFLLENPGYANREWTTPECAAGMEATPAELDAPQLDACVIGLQVGGPWQHVLDEWFAYSVRRELFVGPRATSRHDQTVLSILAARHRVPVQPAVEHASWLPPDEITQGAPWFSVHQRKKGSIRHPPQGAVPAAAHGLARLETRFRSALGLPRRV